MVLLRIIFFWDWPSYPLRVLRAFRVSRGAQLPFEFLSWFGLAINYPFIEWATVRAVSDSHWSLAYSVRVVVVGYFCLLWNHHGGAIWPESKLRTLARDWTSVDLLVKACQWLTTRFPLPLARAFNKAADGDGDLDVGDDSVTVETAQDGGILSAVGEAIIRTGVVEHLLVKPLQPVDVAEGSGSWGGLCGKIIMTFGLLMWNYPLDNDN